MQMPASRHHVPSLKPLELQSNTVKLGWKIIVFLTGKKKKRVLSLLITNTISNGEVGEDPPASTKHKESVYSQIYASTFSPKTQQLVSIKFLLCQRLTTERFYRFLLHLFLLENMDAAEGKLHYVLSLSPEDLAAEHQEGQNCRISNRGNPAMPQSQDRFIGFDGFRSVLSTTLTALCT